MPKPPRHDVSNVTVPTGAAALLQRLPWLIPACSFLAGWIGFIMVHRGAGMARWVALLALLSSLWLFIEPLVRRGLEQRKQRLGKVLANLISQSLQQELLFFALPFIIGATQPQLGQLVFAGLAGLAAMVSTIDPLYERWIAKFTVRRLAFHAYCVWITTLVVLPMVLHLPLERALPLSLAVTTVWLVLTLPLSLASLPKARLKVAWVCTLLALPVGLWAVRDQLPAAGLAVTQARITQSIDGLTPGAPIKTLSQSELQQGVIAFAAIRAPAGMAQTVVFQWRHRGVAENIVEEIHGGSSTGWRTYSRKQNFPEQANGRWTVDILTPQKQLLKRMSFTVTQ